MKVLLDNNAIDKLSSNIEFVKSHPEIKFYICREAVGEVSNNKSYNPTLNIVALLKLGVEYLPNAVFVLGHSLLDGESTFCDEDTGNVYRSILNPSLNNIPDAIIAATAVKNDCVLITNDTRFYKKMKKYDYKVMTFEELIDNFK
ncbi:MAG: PIN domain-containing protein [Clostridiales bacterium]|nr:PIN domain-containing protein [Clostridiales bacterium]